ncbi:unnamed protein product [Mytilus coruscus]|uniref:B box-type domain-containing protein n=1 Tax=Mytilus coruscus TaxID=42192 RepID=A0A6J8BYU7_MYTCO|nr:unnamed protein product [Mytilus coruscus]
MLRCILNITFILFSDISRFEFRQEIKKTMASRGLCDPCTEQGTSSPAVKFCSDCEERFCENCIEDHSKFKVLRSHHLIDLSTAGSKIPTFQKYCDVHADGLLDFFCTQHDVECCRSCIPLKHQSCTNVFPLENVSKNVRNSAVLKDTLDAMDSASKTLTGLMDDTNNNIKILEDDEPAILRELKTVKENLVKQIDKLEEKVTKELSSIKKRKEIKFKQNKTEIAELTAEVQERHDQIDFLKEHGSNNQLFLALRQQEKTIQSIDIRVKEMTSTFVGARLALSGIHDLKFDSIGSVEETPISCGIKHKSMKLNQAQAKPDNSNPITSMQWKNQLNLQSGKDYNLTGIAITADDSILILIPNTDKAIVTLTFDKSIQFIDTTRMKLCNKMSTREGCYGVFANRKNIYLGGNGNIFVLNLKGSFLNKITLNKMETIFSVCFNENNQQVICRNWGTLWLVKLNGEIVYQTDVTGQAGLALDRQGNVYYSIVDIHEIRRIKSDGSSSACVMLKRSDQVHQPYAICFNKDVNKFYVINDCNSIQIYNCN